MNNKKYVIWGAGQRGTYCANVIGRDRIQCYVEENDALLGTKINGIDVISKEEFYSLYSKNPVIITPEGYEEKIETWLKKKKIISFKFAELINVETFLFQYPKRELLSKCMGRKVLVYGLSFLGIEIVNYLKNNGIKIENYYYDGEAENSFFWESMELSCNKQPDDASLILLFRPGNDDCYLKWDFIECYKISTTINYGIGQDIKRFKGIHNNERCFIVATGPSLRYRDLDKLNENREICFGVNSIFKAFGNTEWRPAYYVVGDAEAVEKEYDNIVHSSISEKFISDFAWRFEKNDITPNMHKWHLDRTTHKGQKPRFSNDFSKVAYTGYTIVYDGALQLAAYMGFKEIYLLGVDCNYASTNGENYFYQAVEKKKNHNEQEMILAYESAQQYAKSHGIKIYNATRGGMLEVFERVDFDSLF